MEPDWENLKMVALKACEPFSAEADPERTIGEWRREMVETLHKIVKYVASDPRFNK